MSKLDDLESNGTLGGLLTTWNPMVLESLELIRRNFSLSLKFEYGSECCIINVYGPHTTSQKESISKRTLISRNSS